MGTTNSLFSVFTECRQAPLTGPCSVTEGVDDGKTRESGEKR